MNIKPLIVIFSLLLLTSKAAFADDQTKSFNDVLGGSSHSGSLSIAHSSGDFQDTFTFSSNEAVHLSADFHFDSASYYGSSFSGSSADHSDNGQDFTYTWTHTASEDILHVSGHAGSDGNGYRIDLSEVAPVPEPETYAMLLGGLGLIGAAVRRRRIKIAAV